MEMKKAIIAACAVAVLPVVAFATGEQVDDKKAQRLAQIEEMVITADKAQPADYKPDAKVAALLAEIEKAE